MSQLSGCVHKIHTVGNYHGRCGITEGMRVNVRQIIFFRDATLRTSVLYDQSALLTFTEHPTPLLQLIFTLYVAYSHWNPPT